MNKRYYTIAGIILCVLAAVFMVVAVTHPEFSFPWSNWVSYTMYALYAIYTVLIFCMPKMKGASLASCIILAFQFLALDLIVLSIGIRETSSKLSWYLPAGLFLSCFANFASLYINNKRKKKEEK